MGNVNSRAAPVTINQWSLDRTRALSSPIAFVVDRVAVNLAI
jgi:hypothetical protein